jgi:hypothetical protein
VPERIDAWMPEYDFSERHSTRVRASPQAVWDALGRLDAFRIWLLRILMGLRGIPALVLGPRRTLRALAERPREMTLRSFFREGVVLEDDPPRDLVLGLTGRFWSAAGGLLPTDRTTFRELPPAGSARVAWSFELRPSADGTTTLTTETRIRCPDPAARRAFGRYWLLIRPGSGLIRRAILGAVRREAEHAGAG